MPVDPLALDGEARLRELAEEVLAFLKGKAAHADLLVESVAKAEYQRLGGGAEIVKPHVARSAMTVRLVGAAGRSLDISCGLLPFQQIKERLGQAVGALALQAERPGFGLAEVPHRERRRCGFENPLDLRSGEVVAAFEALGREDAQ